jgi:AraC family transcriptional regulator of adaptative response/methylated-DNA-[protein]-cysteine methyltransferase
VSNAGTEASAVIESQFGELVIRYNTHGIIELQILQGHKQPLDGYVQPHPPHNSNRIISAVQRCIAQGTGWHLLPVVPRGTPFELQVWDHLRTIPEGHTRSYLDVAIALGRPTSVRAVANACARNIIALAIPCHRVIRRDGSSGGYRWGPQLKEHLLRIERRNMW